MAVKRKLEKSTETKPPLKIAKVIDVPNSEEESLSLDKTSETPIVEAPQDKSKNSPTVVNLLSRITVFKLSRRT